MKKKIEREISPLELARQLEQIAASLKSGAIEVDGRQWSVPERLDAKITHKEKKGRFSGKIKFRWSSLPDYDKDAKQEVDQWKASFETLKKRMARELRALQEDIDAERYPGKETLMAFVRDSLEMARRAEPEWQDSMTEYVDHLENLQRAMENHQLEVVRHELRDIRNRMKQCHREFK